MAILLTAGRPMKRPRDIEISNTGVVGLTVTNEFGCTASTSLSVIERSNPAIQVGGG